MIRIKLMSLVMVLFPVFFSGPARADCWAVFSEDFRNTYFQATRGIRLPQRTGNFSNLGECQAALNSMRSDPMYRSDFRLGQTRCECSSASASTPSGGSFEQQLATTVVKSFLNALMSGLLADTGPAGEKQRQALQKRWEKEEQERRLAEKKRQEMAFVNAQAGALNLLGNRPGVQKLPSQGGVDPADGLKPGGTSFFGLGGGPGSGTNLEPMNDPMVVDLRHLRRAAYFVQAVETASTEDVPLLLDEALKTANGTPSSFGNIPLETTLPEIDDSGLLAFQQANIDYAKAHDFLVKCTENFNTALQRRELAYLTAEARRTELEKKMAGKTDKVSLQKKQSLLAEIFATVQAEDEACLRAKAQLTTAEEQADKTREESVRILRALATGKDPAVFHPPIASLPALKEEAWLEMQKRIFDERRKLDELKNKHQKELAYLVPALKSRERVHEGVLLGYTQDENDALKMELNGVSCFDGRTYAAMIQAAKQAQEGKEVGGAMVVAFGSWEQKKNVLSKINISETLRVVGDHWTVGEISLVTPQGQKAVKMLAGKEFDRLVAYSNGASVAEGLIQNDIITVNELNIIGGDRSLANKPALQGLLDSGKVKRVVVWYHVKDPVPGITSLDPMNVAGHNAKNIIHLVKKITGDLAGGNARVEVEYRDLQCAYSRNSAAATEALGLTKEDRGFSIDAHDLESSYYPCIANKLGVKYVSPESDP